jgi:hypothetical protein
VIGPVARGLYVAVMHSGMTLAPEVARLVGEELQALGTRAAEAPSLLAARQLLAPFRADRDFSGTVSAYGWK